MRSFRFIKSISRPLALGALAAIVTIPALLAPGCNPHELQAPDPVPEKQAPISQDVNPIRDLDVLFIVDNSGSMKEEQSSLRENFPVFMEELRKIPGGLPNVHIAVISTDVGAGNVAISGNPACNRPGGDRGVFQTKSTCGLDADARFIIALNNETDKNYTGQLPAVFSCMADLGILGCGFEHQLQSMRVALADITPQNAGFLRPNAYLAIIFLTDEDDCSAPPESDLFVDPIYSMGQQASMRCGLNGHICDGKSPPADVFSTQLANCDAHPTGNGRLIPVKEFIDFAFSLKPKNPEKIIVSAVTGWPDKLEGTPYGNSRDPMRMNLLDIEPACSSGNGVAAPALRVKKFVDAFGTNGRIESICAGDYRPAMQRIGQLIASKIDAGCFTDKLLDTDLNQAGLQAECSVTERVPNEVSGGYTDKVISTKCDAANPAGTATKPCYHLSQEPTCNNNWKVQVFRDGNPIPGTLQVTKCRACARPGQANCF